MSFAEGLASTLGTMTNVMGSMQSMKERDLQQQDMQLGLDLKRKAVARQSAYDDAGKQAWQQWQKDAPVAENGVAQPRDSMDGYLAGMDAMHQKALEMGDYERAAKMFTDKEALRTQLLQKGLGVADTQFAASGGTDYQPYIDLYNKYWNDGRQIKSIGTRQDGAAVIKMQDRDGQGRELVLDKPGQLSQYMAQLRDPAAARQAAVQNARYQFEKTFETNQKIREKKAELDNTVATQGVKLGANEKLVFPDASGKISDTSPSVDNETQKFVFPHDSVSGGFAVGNTRTGALTLPSGGLGGTGDWKGLKPAQINDQVKGAGSTVLDLARNPINGFDEKAQGAIARTAARAEEIMRAGAGRVEQARAAAMALDEAKRAGILSPKTPNAGGLPPSLTLTPRGAAGSNGISFTN